MRPPSWSSPMGVLCERGSERQRSTSALKGSACGDGSAGWDVGCQEKGTEEFYQQQSNLRQSNHRMYNNTRNYNNTAQLAAICTRCISDCRVTACWPCCAAPSAEPYCRGLSPCTALSPTLPVALSVPGTSGSNS